MRVALAAAVLLAGLGLAGAAASLPDGDALPLQPPASLPAAAHPPASPAWPRAEPGHSPELAGPAPIVARAAGLLASSPALPPEQLEALAAEQQLLAALEPSADLGWTLDRIVEAAPPLPAAGAAAEPAILGLAPPATRAAGVAAGAAGVAALVAPKLPAMPFYSRIEREEAMLNRRRAELYALVRSEPGIHLSDLVRRSGLGWGAALYHLAVLERTRVVVAQAEGGFKRYFPNGVHPRSEMARLAALRNAPARALFEAVRSGPGRSGRELAASLGMSPSTLARASLRLERAALIRRVRLGRKLLYFPMPGDVAAPQRLEAPVAVAA